MSNNVEEIRTHTGKTNTNILLIAPHGHRDDDENTGKLTRKIRKKLDCHAIINEVYRKPKKLEDGAFEDPKNENKILDLNSKPQAEKHKNYLSKIMGLIKDPKSTYVFWIHGIDDDNLAAVASKMEAGSIKGLIGFGQPDRHSINQEKAQLLLDSFKEQNLELAFTRDDADNYRGWGTENLNQWFQDAENGCVGVQSIQLEFANNGVRDEASIDFSSQAIAYAISKLVDSKLVPEQESIADEELVKTACSHVKNLIDDNNAILKVGQYLIDTFYAGNYDWAKKKKRFKNSSLIEVFKELNNEGYAPAKTWFYNAVKLAVDENDFKDFRTYGLLGHSHKVYLTHVEEFEDKKDLAEETINQKYTVKKLRERISEISGSTSSSNSPRALKSVDDLKKMTPEKRGKYVEKVASRRDDLDDMIKRISDDLSSRKKEKKACDEWLNQITQANEGGPMVQYSQNQLNSNQEATGPVEEQATEQTHSAEHAMA